jgi:DNA ligase-1
MKPLLASTLEDISQLKLPVYTSPKLDGIRVLIKDGVALTRNLKPVRNKFVQYYLSKPEFEGLDGEILVGSPTDPELFRTTSSGVMAFEGEPDFTYWVFDYWNYSPEDAPFSERLQVLIDNHSLKHDRVKVLPHKLWTTTHEVFHEEMKNFERGYEGTMVRDPNGVYKYGRSTLKEGILLKLKRFRDDEAVVIGFHERMHNANEAKTNALGRTERSVHKENLLGRGDLGALVVKYKEHEITIGTGFSDALRAEIWNNQDKYVGKSVTFKYMEYGNYEVPRFPIFKWFREDI